MAWARRSLEHFRAHRDEVVWRDELGGRTQSLFGIVQGGMYPDLRRESAERLVEMDFDGYAIGGLSVGEPRELTLEMISEVLPLLPADKPRYVMGVGYPDEIEQYARMGVDMMDCVLPTRAARHGLLFTSEGRLNIKGKHYAEDQGPPDPACDCMVCRRYSRAYLRHLMQAGEALSGDAEHDSQFGLLSRDHGTRACRVAGWRNARSPALTRSTTSAQSPGAHWRKRRAVGYQGVVSISCIQRQSLK